ncbi:MAG: sterol desaturase family protein [Chitinophagaceae bacterium]
MLTIYKIFLLVGTYLLMEPFTWFVHKYVMHGFLWVLHKDHHDHSNEGDLERNDFFFLIFSIPSIILLFIGVRENFNSIFFIGLGITSYGMSYFFVHDIFIHQRLAMFRNTKNKYLLSLRRAHKEHHKHIGKEDGECFGFLWVPMKYFKMYFNKSK